MQEQQDRNSGGGDRHNRGEKIKRQRVERKHAWGQGRRRMHVYRKGGCINNRLCIGKHGRVKGKKKLKVEERTESDNAPLKVEVAEKLVYA